MSEVDIVTVSSRGQVSIPADIRRDLGLDLEPMWEETEQADLNEGDAEALVHEQRRD